MQKSGIWMVAASTMIAVGLVLLVVGNQIILEGISQDNGIVSSSQPLLISGYFDAQDTAVGVFAVQIMEFDENTFSVRILDSFDNEMISHMIDEESIEESFDIFEDGEYKLVVESTSNKETLVFGAIGPLPDDGKKSLGLVSVYVLVIGIVGLVGVGVYGIRNKRRSV